VWSFEAKDRAGGVVTCPARCDQRILPRLWLGARGPARGGTSGATDPRESTGVSTPLNGPPFVAVASRQASSGKRLPVGLRRGAAAGRRWWLDAGLGVVKMPPKKKTAKKKVAAKPVVKETDLTLPPLPSAKTSSLLYAVQHSTTTAVSRLVTAYDYGKSLTSVDMNNSTPLHIAAKRGDAAMLEKLLTFKEVDVSKTINSCEASAVGGYAALHHVCALGHVEALKVLLKHGANVNLKTHSTLKEGALHICCKSGPVALACAKVLIDAKIDINAIDGFGHNATYWASTRGHVEMIRILDLPAPHHASADEYLAIVMSRPGFSLAKEKKKPAGAKKKK